MNILVVVDTLGTHDYREFMGGITDWVENMADSKSARAYRNKVSDAESSSMWQSLSHGANCKKHLLHVCLSRR